MYTILTDSCADLSPEIVSHYEDLIILPLSYSMEGVTETKVLDDPQLIKAYYDKLRGGARSTTAQATPQAYYDTFSALVKEGKTVLAVVFSSSLSGTYSSACIGRDMVLEEYPDAQIEVVDTLAASAGEGLMVYDALENRAKGMGAKENSDYLREHAQNYVSWFTVDDLNFLKRGGRCSPSAAFFGSMLNIKPVLHVNEEGKLIARSKVRGRKQALKALADKFGELSYGPDQVIFISHGDCLADAETVKNHLVNDHGCDADKIVISAIGPVIGSHSGPGTVALFFRGKNRG